MVLLDGRKIYLRFVEEASLEIGTGIKNSKKYHVICVKSTVEPGTTETMVGPIIEKYSGKKIGSTIGLCMNPEFLAEGTAVKDFMNPDRIVIGASDAKASNKLKKLYAAFPNTDLITTNLKTAEMIKYASNSFLATTISYTNEIANLCDAIGDVDALEVMNGVHGDYRLSPIINNKRITPGLISFLHPGTGFGGSCFPKDLKSLISFADSINQSMELLKSVVAVNEFQPKKTIEKILEAIKTLNGKKLLFWD